MIYHDSDLFYDIYETTNEHNWRQTHPLIDSKLFWYQFLSESKSFFKLSLFQCITQCLSSSMEKIKFIAIVIWIFHLSDFLDHLWCLLNMVWFYWDILLLIVFYFYPHYFHIQYNCYSKDYLPLLVYNNSLVPLATFSSLKRFLISLRIQWRLIFAIVIHFKLQFWVGYLHLHSFNGCF